MAEYLYRSDEHRTSARKGEDGKPITDVNIKSSDMREFTLHNTTITNSNGTEFTIDYSKTLTVEISGTATSHKLVFEGCSISGTWYPIQGVRLADFAMATETTTKGEVWQFEVTGLSKFRARLATIAGGNISVRGRALS